MLAPKIKRTRYLIGTNWRIELNWLKTEMIACVTSIALAIGVFVTQTANPERASDSVVGIFFLPTTTATGKFIEQLYFEPRLLPSVVETALKNSVISTGVAEDVND